MTISSRAIEIGARAEDFRIERAVERVARLAGYLPDHAKLTRDQIKQAVVTAIDAYLGDEYIVAVKTPSRKSLNAGLDAYWGIPTYRARGQGARTEKEIDGMADAYRAMLSAHQADEDSEGKNGSR
jgi:hypothetical protein